MIKNKHTISAVIAYFRSIKSAITKEKHYFVLSRFGQTYHFDIKVRENEFKPIYALCNDHFSNPICFVNGNHMVVVCGDFTKLGFSHNSSQWPIWVFGDEDKRNKSVKNIFKIQPLAKDLDFVVLKIKYKPLLFIRFLK